MVNSAEFCAGCPFSGNYVDEVTIANGTLEEAKGARSSERLVLRFTDTDGLQSGVCSVTTREYADHQITDDVRDAVVARAVARVTRCSGTGTTTEGRATCRAINETVLSKLLEKVVQEDAAQ